MFVALGIHHAKRMRLIILPPVNCPAPQNLSILSHLRHDFRGKKKVINLLTPNVNCSGRTAPLTSKVAFYIFIQQI